MVHQQHELPDSRVKGLVRSEATRPGREGLRSLLRCVSADDCVDDGTCLQLGLRLLRLGLGVVQKRGTGANLRKAVAYPHRPQGQPRVESAVEANESHGAAVPAPRSGLHVFHELDRPLLRRTRDGHGPRVAQEGVQGIKVLAEVAFHVIDRVNQPRVHLDLPPSDNSHAPWFADAALVVPIDVGAHRELALLLWVREDRLDHLRVLERIHPSRDGA
mmetsp:Transcript_1234/g.5238  ORF Transcript_1234/g.5238 Transcript_1234/m.5238 type:complete len:217 (+) Transcript_1234:673-1323(+)